MAQAIRGGFVNLIAAGALIFGVGTPTFAANENVPVAAAAAKRVSTGQPSTNRGERGTEYLAVAIECDRLRDYTARLRISDVVPHSERDASQARDVMKRQEDSRLEAGLMLSTDQVSSVANNGSFVWATHTYSISDFLEEIGAKRVPGKYTVTAECVSDDLETVRVARRVVVDLTDEAWQILEPSAILPPDGQPATPRAQTSYRAPSAVGGADSQASVDGRDRATLGSSAITYWIVGGALATAGLIGGVFIWRRRRAKVVDDSCERSATSESQELASATSSKRP